MIPAALTAHLDVRLTKRDHRVYGALLALPLTVVEYRPIKAAWVAHHAGMHKPDVIKSVRHLVELGYLTRGPLEVCAHNPRRTYALSVAVALPQTPP